MKSLSLASLLFLIISLFSSSLLKAQSRLSGKFQNPPNSGVGNHYTEVSWQFKYNMAIENGWVVMNAYDIDIRPSATSMYRYNGKILSRGQYGSRSPQLEPCGVIIEVYLSYRGTNYSTRIEFNCDGSTSRIGDGGYSKRESGKVIRVKDIGIADVDAYSFVVSDSRMINFNTRGDNALDRELHERELKEYNGKSNNQNYSNSQNNSNGSSNRPSSTNGTRNSSSSTSSNNTSSSTISPNTTDQGNTTYTIPSAESQMRQLGIDPNKDYLGELISMGGTLLQEINENRRRRWEKEALEAERLEKLKTENTAINTKKYVDYFKKNYVDKYFSAANAGDDAARLMLIMKCKELSDECSNQPNSNYCSYEDFLKAIPINESVPNVELSQWILIAHWEFELVKKNNLDAINLKAHILDKENRDSLLPLLENAAALGSLDAMVILGMFYDQKERDGGGMDELKALYWFTRAANAGCPMAAYYLGMIYRYGHTLRPDNYHKKISSCIAYSIKKDDKVAADWFVKSVNHSKNHKESAFAKHQLICSRILWVKTYSMELAYYGLAISISSPDAFLQLSKMYLNGKGVEKNKAVSELLQKEGEAMYSFYRELK